ncbi:MAG: dTMP kinase, partial [Deltaproteobacteria bacterium]|nr:dTMP kinase [Deltaproteobacteria bacterium]
LLAEYLKSQKLEVVLSREPGGTPLADKIREILLHKDHKNLSPLAELFLYEASRAQHVQEVIRPALAQKKIVLCDRFFDATTVYQGYARGLGRELCRKLNLMATDNLEPDLTFILDCPVEIGLARSHKRLKEEKSSESRFEEEEIDFHQKVREGYLKLAQENPKRVHLINAHRGILEIQKDIQEIIKEIWTRSFSKATAKGLKPSE